MNSLKVDFDKNKIIINGDIESYILSNPRIIGRFENNYHSIDIKDDSLIITDNLLNSPTRIFDFKEMLDDLLSAKLDINYSKEFMNIIESFIIDKNNFANFSNSAKEIWDNNYDISDFAEFTDNLKKNMPNRRLYRLQLLSAYHLAFSQNSCNFSVPGSGKTSIVYGAYSYLKNLDDDNPKKIDRMIILGPYSSFDPWTTEYKECFGKNAKIFNCSGVSKEDKKNALKGLNNSDFEIILMTYQSAVNLEKEIEIFLNSNKTMFVCDEAHKIKAYDRMWSSSVLNLAPFARSRVILTGTPCPNGYEDLFNLFKFIYTNRSVLPYRYDFLKIMSKNALLSQIKELKESISPYFSRIKKSDLNLPPVNNHPSKMNVLSDLEEMTYFKILKAMSLKESNRFSLYHRLIQSCSNLLLLKKPLDEIESISSGGDELKLDEILGDELYHKIVSLDQNTYVPSKHLELIELIKTTIKKDEKIVIWCKYIDSIKMLHNLLKINGYNGDYVIGDTSSKENVGEMSERSRLIHKFKNDPSSNYIISNPMVLGESVSLHKVCHNAIYLEMDFNAATYFQSRDRIHRVWLEGGIQKNYETNYFNIISVAKDGSSTYDSKIIERVDKKIEKMLQIIEDDIPLFVENEEEERDLIISELISEYENR